MMLPLRVISLPLGALLACTATLAESDVRVGCVLSSIIDVYITITHLYWNRCQVQHRQPPYRSQQLHPL